MEQETRHDLKCIIRYAIEWIFLLVPAGLLNDVYESGNMVVFAVSAIWIFAVVTHISYRRILWQMRARECGWGPDGSRKPAESD